MKRLMRLRASQHLRDLCAETEFNRAQLIQPFFVVEGLTQDEPIAGLRGNVRHNISSALKQIEKDLADGVTQFLLFPVPAEKKDEEILEEDSQEAQLQYVIDAPMVDFRKKVIAARARAHYLELCELGDKGAIIAAIYAVFGFRPFVVEWSEYEQAS